MRGHWRSVAIAGLSLAAVAVTATLVTAATKKRTPEPAAAPAKPMSVEEARKVVSRSTNLTRPPRTIDDISKVLELNKPDPEKIRKLRETADKQPPPHLSGMALADFFAERGRAARDLGRTQQRLADLREAYKLAKPLVMRRGAIWVADFPTPSNPMGSAAFQAYVNAKRAARMAAGGGSGGGRDMGAMTPQERMRYASRGGGGGGVSGPPAGTTNLDFMPKSPEESRQRFAERVSPDQQRAVRIWQDLVSAEADAGNYTAATAIYEEARSAVLTTMSGSILGMDVRMTSIRLAAGDIEGAKRVVARVQQMASLYRQHSFLSPMWNNQAATIESGLAGIALATGQNGEAELRYRNAMRLTEAAMADAPRMPSPVPASNFEFNGAALRLQLAQSLFRQNKLIESEVEIRRALLDFLRLQGVDAPKTAHTVLIFADVLQAQGRYKDAQRLAETALDIYVRGGVDPALHADALQRIAVGQASQGRWAEAMATYDKLKAAVANSDVARKRYVDTNLDLAVALVRSGQAAAAIPILEGVVSKRTTSGGDSEYALAEARGFLATALAAAGRRDEAIRAMTAVVPVLLAGRDAAAKEEGAIDEDNRRRMIVESYFTLLTEVRGTEIERTLGLDATDQAFRMADAAHAKSVHSAIAAVSARAAGDGALNELIRQTQDTDQKLTAMSDMLKATLEASAAEQDAGVVQTLRKDIAQLQQARKTLRAEIERRFPQYAQLVNPKPVGIAEARAKLGQGDVLVVTYFSGDRGYVWAVPKQGEVAFAPMALPQAEIARHVDEIYQAVNSNAVTVNEVPPFSVAAAHKLYTALLAPVAAGLNGAKTIVVVPDGTLGRLPFALLVRREVAQPSERDGELKFAAYREIPFLVRDVTVTHVPSVAAFASLRSAPAGAAGRKPFLGFGDPWFSAKQAAVAQQEHRDQTIKLAMAGAPIETRAAPNTRSMATAELGELPRLSDTADEVREIARALGADPVADVILGAQASEKAVRTMRLDDRRVVMFATHGLVPGDLDGLTQPALALSSPEVSGVEGDGLLTVEKILGLKLDADWVVLSACNTAAGEGGSAEAVSGLGRAFFYAGARALLVTHWPVETVSARLLTTDLFRRQAASGQLGRAEALRDAMLSMIDSGARADDGGRPLFAYAHPLFWASFALVGDGEAR